MGSPCPFGRVYLWATCFRTLVYEKDSWAEAPAFCTDLDDDDDDDEDGDGDDSADDEDDYDSCKRNKRLTTIIVATALRG